MASTRKPEARSRKTTTRGKAAGRKTVMTATPTPNKAATPLSAEKYETVKKIILKALPKSREGMALKDLSKVVREKAPAEMLPKPGSASWLTMAVKLDLEVRGQIERIAGVVPQRLRRVK